jgi:hypothetical protein
VSTPRRPAPRVRSLPRAGVLRLHYEPGALPASRAEPGHNRLDDPRPNSLERFLVRYTATTLRGCLLESLDWLRPNPDAGARERDLVDDAEPEEDLPDQPEPWSALQDFLQDRQVGVLVGRGLRVLSLNDPRLQAELDHEPAVRALLDSTDGRAALAPAGRGGARLDQAAVRLSTPFGRELTQACSLAIWDRRPRPDGVHHRSRHDDDEHCWALYDHATVRLVEITPFDPASNSEHRRAVQQVANLWSLALPPGWAAPATDLTSTSTSTSTPAAAD